MLQYHHHVLRQWLQTAKPHPHHEESFLLQQQFSSQSHSLGCNDKAHFLSQHQLSEQQDLVPD